MGWGATAKTCQLDRSSIIRFIINEKIIPKWRISLPFSRNDFPYPNTELINVWRKEMLWMMYKSTPKGWYPKVLRKPSDYWVLLSINGIEDVQEIQLREKNKGSI